MSSRTLARWTRVYIDGYDWSGNTRSIGPASVSYPQIDCVTLSDAICGYLPGQSDANIGALNAVLNNTATSGVIALGDAGKGAQHSVIIAQGMRAEPANGDPAFAGQFMQSEFSASAGTDGSATVNMPFASWSASASTLLYGAPWGKLIHAKGAETGANTADASNESSASGAATTKGGYAVFMLFTSTGAVTLSVQDSVDEVNANYGALISSGALDASSTPQVALVALAPNATVKQYTRWQTTAAGTFAICFVRAYH